MTVDLNNTEADGLLDQFDTDFPAGAVLEIYSGSPPGAENAASGTLLASITLPSSPWASASGGSKAKANTWSDSSADGSGTAGWFRLRNAGDTKRLDGTVSGSGGGGDIELDNAVIAAGQTVTMSTFAPTM